MAAQTCFFNKYGFCKYSDSCRKYHEKRICEKLDCEIRDCHLRHPKVCKYYRDFGFCKFSEWCKFSHKVSKFEINDKDSIITKLEEKVKNLEMKIEEIVNLQGKKSKN